MDYFMPTAPSVPTYVKDFLLKDVFKHPKVNESNMPYLDYIKDEFAKIDKEFTYLKYNIQANTPYLLSSLSPNTLLLRVLGLQPVVKDICNTIIESLSLFFSSNPKAPYLVFGTTSYKKIEQCLDNNIHFINNLFSIKLGPNETLLDGLYKMRNCSPKGRLFTAKEMFHIPFELRRLASTMRFSIPSIPAIYLANNLYICRDEIQADPSNGSVQGARFRLNDSIRVLNLAYNNRNISEYASDRNTSQINDLIIAWLVLYPFALASAVRKNNSQTINGVTPEYVLPQMLMEYVVNSPKAKLDGIRYLSTRIISNDSHINFYACWAFPCKSDAKSGYDPNLCKKFLVTNGVRLPVRNNKKIDSSVFSGNIVNSNNRVPVNYRASAETKVFADAESRLWRQKPHKIIP